jgi:hypothetical protein
MSTRLTKWDRERIAEKMVADALKERKAANAEAHAAMATRIYAEVLGKKTLDLLASLPEGFVPTVSNFGVYVAGEWMRLYLPDKEYRCPEKLKRECWAVFDSGTPTADELFSIDAEKDAIEVAERSLKATIGATLNSFRSAEAMVREWPETEPYVPKHKAPVAALPCTTFSDINAMLEAAKGAGVAA